MDKQKYKMCSSKRRFKSLEEATSEPGYNGYKCPYCKGFHRSTAVQRLINFINTVPKYRKKRRH